MTPARLRKLLRVVHLVAAAAVGTYLYSPWSSNDAFSAIILYLCFPAMALSGVAMWRQGALQRLLSRRS